MDIIKTGIDLTKTIKNVARLREIVSVLAKNGFYEFVIKTGIHQKIPDFVLPNSTLKDIESEIAELELDHSSQGKDWKKYSWGKIVGNRLKKAFEELGPTFIKLGQLLSTRDDMFNSAFIEEMKKLLDQVKGIPFPEAKKAIEESIGKKLEDVFKNVDSTAIGTASIGIVYKGELLSGEQVVIKIRRPNIEKVIKTDISILLFLADKLESVSEEIKHLGITRIIDDFAHTLQNELDFNLECMNCEKLKQNIARVDTESIFHLPKMYKEYGRENLIVMEYLDGIYFSRIQEIKPYIHIIEPKLIKGIKIFVNSLLEDGFFHADLHGGNFLFLKNQQIGIIDFGLVGSIQRRGRVNLISILYALVTYDYENLAYEFLEVAEYDTIPDIDVLTLDIKRCVEPFIGLTVRQMNFSKILGTVIKTLSKHGIYLPRDWFVVFRAMMVIDGVGRSLGINYEIFALLDESVKEKVKKIFSKEELMKDGMWGLKDLSSSLRMLPRHLKWFVKEFAKRNYAVEIKLKGLEKDFSKLSNAIIFASYVFLSGIFIFAGVYVLDMGSSGNSIIDSGSIHINTWTIILWLFGGLIFFRGKNFIKKNKKE
ncbi:MAG: AarF/ABC1/UbiB kinase family protein [Oligoflexia bacterium]|nr:AarF/ABC1/UbiB kinase family protein [Oligoflexia bacterium]